MEAPISVCLEETSDYAQYIDKIIGAYHIGQLIIEGFALSHPWDVGRWLKDRIRLKLCEMLIKQCYIYVNTLCTQLEFQY